MPPPEPAGAVREPGHSHTATRLAFGVGSGIAATVYGTLTAMATVTAFGNETHPWKLAELVAATAVVLWLAHIYAHGLSQSIAARTPLRVQDLKRIAERENGIVLASVPPASALVLGAIGLIREERAVWLAIGVGLATLVVEGLRYARLEQLGRLRALGAIAANLTLGLVVVALKVALAH